MFKIALIAVSAFIAFVTLIALSVGLSILIFYIKHDRCDNGLSMSGAEAAKKILGLYGLDNITVLPSRSLLLGNRYSRRKNSVHLRVRYYRGRSVAALAMGAQKAAFAVLDNEGDKAVKKRARFAPIISFGPIAYIPLVVLGALTDYFFFNAKGFITEIFCGAGTFFYLLSIVFVLFSLRAEKNAQIRAYEILRERNAMSESEMEEVQKRFRIFNFQYVNDALLSVFELVYDAFYSLSLLFMKKEKDRNF